MEKECQHAYVLFTLRTYLMENATAEQIPVLYLNVSLKKHTHKNPPKKTDLTNFQL